MYLTHEGIYILSTVTNKPKKKTTLYLKPLKPHNAMRPIKVK